MLPITVIITLPEIVACRPKGVCFPSPWTLLKIGWSLLKWANLVWARCWSRGAWEMRLSTILVSLSCLCASFSPTMFLPNNAMPDATHASSQPQACTLNGDLWSCVWRHGIANIQRSMLGCPNTLDGHPPWVDVFIYIYIYTESIS